MDNGWFKILTAIHLASFQVYELLFYKEKIMNFNSLENSKVSGMQSWQYKRISWAAILAGVITALVVEALLNLLGLGINLISFIPDKEVLTGLGIGSIIWLIIVSIIALFIAGWVSGLASGKHTNISGALQGFITWAMSSLIVLLFMATTTGVIVGGVTSLLARGLKSAGELTLNQKDNIDFLKLPGINTMQQRLKPGISKEKIFNDVTEAAQSYVTADNDQEKANARQSLSSIISENTDLSPQESEQKITYIEQKYQKVKEQAEKQSKKISSFIGGAAIAAFCSFLLSAIAGIMGGIIGCRRNSQA